MASLRNASAALRRRASHRNSSTSSSIKHSALPTIGLRPSQILSPDGNGRPACPRISSADAWRRRASSCASEGQRAEGAPVPVWPFWSPVSGSALAVSRRASIKATKSHSPPQARVFAGVSANTASSSSASLASSAATDHISMDQPSLSGQTGSVSCEASCRPPCSQQSRQGRHNSGRAVIRWSAGRGAI
jgi:hypothetical protein